jgi:hypothetical protein
LIARRGLAASAEYCRTGGLPQWTAHGLKKAGATIEAENGATTRQLMAMFDWETVAMAEVYIKAAEQKRTSARRALPASCLPMARCR